MYRIMRRINLVSRCQSNYLADKLKDTGLLPCYHGYILTVCRNPGISQEELAKFLCVNKSNVARTLAQMEERGLVERRSSAQDKRILQVFPTEQLLERLPQVRQLSRDWNSYLTAEISEEEMEVFQNVLDKIVSRASAYAEKGEAALR